MARLNPIDAGQVVTTERTGKGLKLQILISGPVCVIGFVLFLMMQTWRMGEVGGYLGLALFVACFIWFAMIQFFIWWRHG